MVVYGKGHMSSSVVADVM